MPTDADPWHRGDVRNGNAKVKVARDVVVIALGSILLLHEMVFAPADPLLVGAALLLLGVPAALRLDDKR